MDLTTAPDAVDLSGFRLWGVELLNWGTFDGAIAKFPVDGRDAWFTGPVGAGKSTVIDALTTLLVPTNRITYNKAAGADKGERKLETYLRGVYSSEADETGTRAKAVALRDTSKVTALLAHFRDAVDGTDVTFCHLYYFTSAGSVEKVFLAADKQVGLEELFAGAGQDIRSVLRLVRRRMTDVGGARDYHREVRKRLGLAHSQALELWFQTVSMKQVENLTTFVRSHMLEPPDETVGKINDLIAHNADLTASAEAIETARRQLSILDPLVVALDEYDQHSGDGNGLLRIRDEVLDRFYERLMIDLVETETATAEANVARHKARRDGLATKMDAADKQITALEKAIENEGGSALNQIDDAIKAGEKDLGERQTRRNGYETRCRQAGLVAAVTFDEFATVRAEARRLLGEAQEMAGNSNLAYDVFSKRQGLSERVEQIERDIRAANASRSNIPARLLDARAMIVEASGIRESDLPFVGELVQVRAEYREWEPAIQRLLSGFGTLLLVPEQLYARVNPVIDRTNLRTKLMSQRVPADMTQRRRHAPGTVPDTVEVADHAMADWVSAELSRAWDYTLADDVQEFMRLSERAVTKSGQIKHGRGRHEKDDRFRLGDRSQYVLGWDNAAKIDAFREEAQALQTQIDGLTKQLDGIEARQRLARQVETATGTLLAEYPDFSSVDVDGMEAILAGLHEQRADMLSESSSLAAMIRQKEGQEDARARLKEQHDAASEEVGRWATKASDLTRNRLDLPEVPPEIDDADQTYLLGLHAISEGKIAAMTVNNNEKVKSETRSQVQRALDNARDRANVRRELAVRKMQEYLGQFKVDQQSMDATMESANDFRALHKRVVDDDLPRFEAEFRRHLSENTIREIAAFNQHLEERRTRIRERVDRINESLVGINYTPDTYIKLEANPSSDQDLAAFRRDLRECIDGTLGSGDDTYTHERFLQVQAIIERFKGRDGRADDDRAWTARVTDVRNWYTFAIVEKDRASDEPVAYYSDSEGKSGGEKEKLAYTVLAAALSYQFGLVPGENRAKTFRFIALDEAFARGTDVSTRFALELFKTMGLQLLIVTPLQKKEAIAPYVHRVAIINRDDKKRSIFMFIPIEDYIAKVDAARRTADALTGAGTA